MVIRFKSDAQRKAVMAKVGRLQVKVKSRAEMSKIHKEKYPKGHRMAMTSYVSGLDGVDYCVYDFNRKRLNIYVTHMKDIDKLKILIPKIFADRQLQDSVDTYKFWLSVKS